MIKTQMTYKIQKKKQFWNSNKHETSETKLNYETTIYSRDKVNTRYIKLNDTINYGTIIKTKWLIKNTIKCHI